MGNLFPLCALNIPCTRLPACKSRRKVLKVAKPDGEVIEFTAPILVKELLMNFEGFKVSSSRKSCDNLPPGLELQLGRIYYLHPCKAPDQITSEPTISVSPNVEPETSTPVKRIKVVVTKKQLKELLISKKASSLEKILLGVEKACFVNSAENWKPRLNSIPEENELSNSESI